MATMALNAIHIACLLASASRGKEAKGDCSEVTCENSTNAEEALRRRVGNTYLLHATTRISRDNDKELRGCDEINATYVTKEQHTAAFQYRTYNAADSDAQPKELRAGAVGNKIYVELAPWKVLYTDEKCDVVTFEGDRKPARQTWTRAGSDDTPCAYECCNRHKNQSAESSYSTNCPMQKETTILSQATSSQPPEVTEPSSTTVGTTEVPRKKRKQKDKKKTGKDKKEKKKKEEQGREG